MSTATLDTTPDRIRRAADSMDGGACRGAFRRRPLPAASAEAERLTLDAVERAKQGDDDAVRYLYLRYAESVYGYVASIVRDPHEAEDVTQLVFARLLAALGRFEPRAVPFSGWLLRIAHNTAVDHVRGRRTVPCAQVHADEAVAADPFEAGGHALPEAFAALTPEQRVVVVLRLVHGLSPGEIADRMGRTESSVQALGHRGRTRLRAELTRLGSGPATRTGGQREAIASRPARIPAIRSRSTGKRSARATSSGSPTSP